MPEQACWRQGEYMKNEEMARLFSEATPYIQKYHGKTMGMHQWDFKQASEMQSITFFL